MGWFFVNQPIFYVKIMLNSLKFLRNPNNCYTFALRKVKYTFKSTHRHTHTNKIKYYGKN